MAGKKKKPAANPARGFATTSVASKPKPEKPEDASSVEPSGVNTPSTKAATPATKNDKTSDTTKNAERELHELSPEELEAQLEASELQQFVEQYAGKVRKESSRHVSRLQTDKRLLRGQSEYMSVRDWLPKELMQQIVEYATQGNSNDPPGTTKRTLPKGDDLVSKVWQLRLCLTGLEIPDERVGDAIAQVLSNPPADDASGQPWGLPEALDWLSWNCNNEEMNDYDYEKPKITASAQDPLDESPEAQDSKVPKWKTPQTNAPTEIEQPGDDGIEVSDIESDLEPDELLFIYLSTKARLFDLDPEGEGGMAKKNQGKGQKGQPATKPAPGRGQKKLQARVQRIESDVLFDRREGEAQWNEKKIDLAREFSERRKW